MNDPSGPTPGRLTRSTHDRMIAGVCGGLAAYTGLDATVLRVAIAVLAVLGGSGVAIYLVAWFLIPSDDGRPSAAESLFGRRRAS